MYYLKDGKVIKLVEQDERKNQSPQRPQLKENYSCESNLVNWLLIISMIVLVCLIVYYVWFSEPNIEPTIPKYQSQRFTPKTIKNIN